MVAEEFDKIQIHCDSRKVLKENTLEDCMNIVVQEVENKLKSYSVPIVVLLLSPKLLAKEHLRLPVRDLVRFPLDLIEEITSHILDNITNCNKQITKMDGKLIVPSFIPVKKNQMSGTRYENLFFSKLFTTANERLFHFSKKTKSKMIFLNTIFESKEKSEINTKQHIITKKHFEKDYQTINGEGIRRINNTLQRSLHTITKKHMNRIRRRKS